MGVVSSIGGIAAVSFVALEGAFPAKAQNAWVTMQWPQYTNDTTAVGYAICYGSVNGDYTNVVAVPGDLMNTNVTIIGLEYGAAYRFAVVLYNDEGITGVPGPGLSWTAPTAPPTGLRVLGYNLKAEQNLESAAVVGLSPLVWSILDPLLDPRSGAVEVASRQKPKTGS